MVDETYDGQRRTVAVTLVVAAACWAVAILQMRGMDMGVDTTLGSFGFFVGVWAAMMAAMMLPGAVPAVVGYARSHRHVGAAVMFVVAYLAVWTLAGIATYSIYRPHGAVAAGIVTVAAGLYELTPIKRRARQRCQERVRSGFHLGLYCLGSTIGLMALLLALGPMSIAWMSAIALVVLAQKLARPCPLVDVTLALALIAFGAATI